MTKLPDIIVDPGKRQEFVFLFDVQKGNPNGDPDAGNAPRIVPQTGRGLVSDVALKRKVRDYLALTQNMPIFIQSDLALNKKKEQSAERMVPPLTAEEKKSKRPILRIGQQVCADYYDVRVFGAVLATGDSGDRYNAGQVRGPVQITFADSIDRISPMYQALTRQARTTETRMETGDTEFGGKWIIPYALYRAHGFVNPYFADKTGMTSADLEAFWLALINLFEFDRSASRGEMSVCGLHVFTHDNKLGDAPARHLFDLIRVEKKGDAANDAEPNRFQDYTITVDRPDKFPGVTLTSLVG